MLYLSSTWLVGTNVCRVGEGGELGVGAGGGIAHLCDDCNDRIKKLHESL